MRKNVNHRIAIASIFQFTNGWFSDPIFLSGDYPPLMKEAIAKKSKELGSETSRLPVFSEEEKKMIKGIGRNIDSRCLQTVTVACDSTESFYCLSFLNG